MQCEEQVAANFGSPRRIHWRLTRGSPAMARMYVCMHLCIYASTYLCIYDDLWIYDDLCVHHRLSMYHVSMYERVCAANSLGPGHCYIGWKAGRSIFSPWEWESPIAEELQHGFSSLPRAFLFHWLHWLATVSRAMPHWVTDWHRDANPVLSSTAVKNVPATPATPIQFCTAWVKINPMFLHGRWYTCTILHLYVCI